MSETEEIACVLVSVRGARLLLPGVTIAEVVKMQRIRPVKTTPAWHLGLLPWRGHILPVLSFEQLLDPDADVPPPRVHDAMLVMNRTRPRAEPEFYALLIRGLPRMLWVNDHDLESASASTASAVAMRVQLVGGGEALIPDLTHLEDLVVEHHLVPKARTA
jgi:chemotaxis signal transduction protein